jgi:Tol biopolymer transport system component
MKTGSTKIVSRSSNGVRSNGSSFRPAISASGRFIAFDSDADHLIDGKTIAGRQVYLRDRKTGKTTLISVNNSGQVANNQSTSPDISANGRYVTFQSAGSNLNGKAKTGHFQIYLRDRWQGKAFLISKNNAGKAGSSSSSRSAISPDGSQIVYDSRSNNLSKAHDNVWTQVYLFNRGTGRTSLVSKNRAGEAGKYGGSSRPAISTKGKIIVFDSNAKNLLGWGNDKNKGHGDVFRLANGKLSVVSRTWQGKQDWGGSWDPDISPNGRYLTFYSYSRNMLKAKSNGEAHIYVRDLATGKLKRASVTAKKGNGNTLFPRISDDGRYVIMESRATNLVPGSDANGTMNDVLRRGPLR